MSIFSSKIQLSDKIEKFILCVKNINWFKNCGEKYLGKIEYDVIFEESLSNASKHLIQENHGNFKNIENLFGVADSRLNWFFEKNIRKEQSTRNRLIDFMNRRFKNNKEIDFNDIENNYCKVFSINKPRYNWFYWMFSANIIEMYFQDNFKNIPIFYSQIIDIYKNGHIITGWQGKFKSQDLCLDTPIEKQDGKIIVY
jgi:hypothetical protein